MRTQQRLDRGRGARTYLAGLVLYLALSSYSAAQDLALDRANSFLVAVTGKSGLFSFAAHEHAIAATAWTMDDSIDATNLTASSLRIEVRSASLVIDSAEARERAELGPGPGQDDIRTIQARMLSPEVLDVTQFPTIVFNTTSVTVRGESELRVRGTLQIHGTTREVEIPVRYERNAGGGVAFTGRFTIKQTDYGMKPESVAFGTVTVKDEVRLQFRVSFMRAGE